MVSYRALQKARDTVKVCFGESRTYDWSLYLSVKYQDPTVWCYAVAVFIADWNRLYYKGRDVGEVVTEIVYRLCPMLEEIKDVILRLRILKLDEISDEDFESLKPIVVGLYNRFSEVLGFTGATKALHILVPQFFVMWDKEIREFYKMKSDAEDYYEFLKKMRLELRRAVEMFSADNNIDDYSRAREELEKILGKPLLKVLDEYNWLTISKGYRV